MLNVFKKLNFTGLHWIWVSVIVFIIDRLTKFSAQHYLTAYSSLEVNDFFSLTLAYNSGAAFSFLDKASGWQGMLFGVISIVVSVVLLIWLYRLPAKKTWVGIAIALIVGGAWGNLSDRLLYGVVIDFLDFHVGHLHWPAFNVADSAICVGAIMLLWDAVFLSKK